jgi:phenylpropionate dioxygenase-like ring-hydroxylating dioxygenase large terminal subunit
MTDVHARPTVVHEAAPIGPVPITAERYTSAQWAAREQEQLWPRQWLFACLERDVAEPGEYAVFSLGDESILVSRTDAGELAAFYNVCQHRGARVMVNDRGWIRQFVCPYHGWAYERDGRLSVVPDIERFGGGVDCAARSLRPVRVEAFAGLVWVCMDSDADDLRAFLGPVWDRLEPYRVQDMALVGDQTVHLDCNWKAVFDNFGELYHVEHIHPQHEKMFDCPTAQIDLFAGGHTGVIIDGHTVNTRLPLPDTPNAYLRGQLEMVGLDPDEYRGRVLDVRSDVQRARREAGPRLGFDYSMMSDERLSDIEQYNVFPNTMLTVQPDSALVMRARPHPEDPQRCFWDKFTFVRQPSEAVAEGAGVAFEPHDPALVAPIERPAHDEFTQDDIISGAKTMTITIDQDIHLIRDVQAGMRSRGFDTALLCDDEVRVQHYHDWLTFLLDAAASGR